MHDILSSRWIDFEFNQSLREDIPARIISSTRRMLVAITVLRMKKWEWVEPLNTCLCLPSNLQQHGVLFPLVMLVCEFMKQRYYVQTRTIISTALLTRWKSNLYPGKAELNFHMSLLLPATQTVLLQYFLPPLPTQAVRVRWDFLTNTMLWGLTIRGQKLVSVAGNYSVYTSQCFQNKNNRKCSKLSIISLKGCLFIANLPWVKKMFFHTIIIPNSCFCCYHRLPCKVKTNHLIQQSGIPCQCWLEDSNNL